MGDQTCPAYREPNCFVTGLHCPYSDKFNCIDYRNYVPKRPQSRDVVEAMHVNTGLKRLGNPLGAIADGIDHLDRSIRRGLYKALGEACGE